MNMKKMKSRIIDVDRVLERIDEELREINRLLDGLATTSSLTTTSFESIKDRVRRLLAYNPVTDTFDDHTLSMISLSTVTVDDIRNELYQIRDSLMRSKSKIIVNRGLSDWLLYGDEEEYDISQSYDISPSS